MSDFTSLKDLFGSPEFQEKVRLGKIEKDKQRNGYTPELWERNMRKFDAMSFPEQFFVGMANCHKDNAYSSHQCEGQSHSVNSFVKNVRYNWVFETEWRFVYCPTCKKVIHKMGTLLNKVENLAYTRWFMRNGKDSQATYETKSKEAPKPEELEPTLVFDGQVDLMGGENN